MNQAMKVVALPLCYQEFIEPIRARVVAINTPHQILEQHMQLTPGYLGKVLGLAQVKNIGFDSMWKILDGIGYRLAVIEHLDLDAARDEIEDYRLPRVIASVKPGTRVRGKLHAAVISAAAAQMAMRGKGVPKRFSISRFQLSKIQRAKAKVRWAKARASVPPAVTQKRAKG